MATTMTIRGLEDTAVKALKEKAKRDGTSLNAAVVAILNERLGLKKRPRIVIHTDLDHLAGTWSEKDYLEFKKKTEDFEKVDEGMWR